MTTKTIIILLISSIVFTGKLTAINQKTNKPINRILFVFDASQSMLGRWQTGRKIDIAKNLLSNMVDSLKNIENLEIGLRVYGHKSGYPPKDCDDTHLEVNFMKSKYAVDIIKKYLKVIQSRGTTPIARSLEEGAKDFPDDNARNIVILITDGKEECGMDPCAVSRLYQRDGIILKPFVIGVGLDKTWKESFDCVGRFFDASSEEDFTGTPKYNYIHTLNAYGNPDTMIIDPVLSYKVVAHTLPPVSINNVTLNPGKHTNITLEAPQGKLKIKMNSKIKYQYIVRQSGVDTTLNIQEINKTEKYLTGKYDIELLTLPKWKKRNVNISANKSTVFTIPNPGIASIILPSKGYGGLYIKNGDNLEQIYHFRGKKNEHRLNLLPGKYKVIFRPLSVKEYIYTVEKNFKIQSGKSKLVKIY